jgi:inosine-uridine nucleoside N-ribohydrolase
MRSLRTLALLVATGVTTCTFGQGVRPERIIIDTDIGGDIDDAFAVALALKSPELEVLGFTTNTGDTLIKARILDRMLGEAGLRRIPVAVGVPRRLDLQITQRQYAQSSPFPPRDHPPAVDFLLEEIRRRPGQITLVTMGPLTNLAALIDKDVGAFRQLKRVVMMAGSIERGPLDLGYQRSEGPSVEPNIAVDIPAAQKVFAAGVPLYLMTLDATLDLRVDEVRRNMLFGRGTPITTALAVMYHEWAGPSGWAGVPGTLTPTLFDPMTIAFIIDPTLCPVKPLRIRVDDAGFTRVETGATNSQVCLESNAERFLRFYMQRILSSEAQEK